MKEVLAQNQLMQILFVVCICVLLYCIKRIIEIKHDAQSKKYIAIGASPIVLVIGATCLGSDKNTQRFELSYLASQYIEIFGLGSNDKNNVETVVRGFLAAVEQGTENVSVKSQNKVYQLHVETVSLDCWQCSLSETRNPLGTIYTIEAMKKCDN